VAIQKELFQYVFDASSLINIERHKKMGELRRRKGGILIPEKVAVEVNMPNSPLHKFISKYPTVVTSFQKTEEREYLRVRSQVGIDDGEAAAIAISSNRRLPLVIDDKKGQTKAGNHGIKTLSWQDFLK
jgi:predicted nucleic acid-binding protein